MQGPPWYSFIHIWELSCVCWPVSISTEAAGCGVKQNTPRHVDNSFPSNPEHRRIMKVTICSPQPPQGRDLMTWVGGGERDMATRWRWEVVMGRLPPALTLKIYHLPPHLPNPPETPPGGLMSQTRQVLAVRGRQEKISLIPSPDLQHQWLWSAKQEFKYFLTASTRRGSCQ